MLFLQLIVWKIDGMTDSRNFVVFRREIDHEMIIISHFSNVFRSTFFHVLKVFFENFHVFLCAFWEELKKRMCVLSGILNRTRQHWSGGIAAGDLFIILLGDSVDKFAFFSVAEKKKCV